MGGITELQKLSIRIMEFTRTLGLELEGWQADALGNFLMQAGYGKADGR